jgi:hypothetical protein
MSSVILTGDTSGTLTVSAPLVAGSNTVTLPAATGTISLLAQATAVASTSGTSIDFTGIPSWAKRITVMFSGLSTSGTSNYLVQLGDAGGVENTGYVSAVNNGGSSATSTAGFLFTQSTLAASLQSGSMIISLLGSNTWVEQGCGVIAAGGMCFMAGSKTLSDTLIQVRITTVNGTDTFDAGSINVMWEG